MRSDQKVRALVPTVMNESVSMGQRWMHRNRFTHAHPRDDAHHFAFTHESVDQLTDFLLRKRPDPLHCALNLQFSLDNIREGAAANCTHQSYQHGPYLRRADPDQARKVPVSRESSQSPSALCSRCTLCGVLGKPPRATPCRFRKSL